MPARGLQRRSPQIESQARTLIGVDMKDLRVALVFAAGVSCIGGVAAAAEVYPSKPVRLVVPYPPAGGVDAIARLISPKLSERLGQQIVLDNRGGAGGNIGTEYAARAPRDGYTLMMGAAALAINVTLYDKLPFDPVRDFVAISLLASTPNIITVHPSMPVRSVKDLIRTAQKTPGSVMYGSAGNGTTSHLAAELMKSMAKIDLVHVPYKGTTGALVALLSGEAPLMFAPALTVLPQINGGKLRAVAITSSVRSAALPRLPTVAESGLPGYEASQWYGLLAPAQVSPQIITLLHARTVEALRDPAVTAQLAKEGSIPIGGSPVQFAEHLKSEIGKWAKVVKQSGATVD
jgi:tripartite-type tricarboxylate transporter receptor subunit TctC